MLTEENMEIVLDELFENLKNYCKNSCDNVPFDFSIFYLSLLVEFRYSFNEAAYNCIQSFFVGLLSSGKITFDYYHILMNALNNEYDYLYRHRQEKLVSMREEFLN